MTTDFLRNAAAAFCLFFLAACAAVIVDLPAVSDAPGSQKSPGKIIWRDLLSNDVEASKKFYGTLFGWEFEPVGRESGFGDDSAYTLIRHDGQLIGGIIDTVAMNGRDDISQWIVAMSVDDIDRAVASAAEKGGEIITPPTDLKRRGRLAVVADAEGALIALLQTRAGDPPDQEPVLNGFLWEELWTSDIDSATGFYTALAGLGLSDRNVAQNVDEPAVYRILESSGLPRVGIMPHPLNDLGPVWVSYLRVASPADIAARVDSLGGRVIVEAQARPIGGEVAFIAGPSGAGIALQTWPLEQ